MDNAETGPTTPPLRDDDIGIIEFHAFD